MSLHLSFLRCGEALPMILDLYRENPFIHPYLLYDIIYYPLSTEVTLSCEREERIDSYILSWKNPFGKSILSLHLWGRRGVELLEKHDIDGDAVILLLYGDAAREEENVISVLKNKGYTLKANSTLIDMMADEGTVDLSINSKAVLLGPAHAEEFSKLRKSQGRRLGLPEAKVFLSKNRCYGVFSGSMLVSVACRQVFLPEVSIIGGVYTRPGYRGLGFATEAARAITNTTVVSGSKALLHVEQDNKTAIGIYRRLGYKETSYTRRFLFFRKGGQALLV